jgi:hypothetical protein
MKREALASALSVERARRLGQPGVRRRRTHLAESRRLTRDAASSLNDRARGALEQDRPRR